jgi:hypothetical protein
MGLDKDLSKLLDPDSQLFQELREKLRQSKVSKDKTAEVVNAVLNGVLRRCVITEFSQGIMDRSRDLVIEGPAVRVQIDFAKFRDGSRYH